MEIKQLGRGQKIAAVGGLALIVALFLPWFKENGISSDAWEALTVIDLVLFVAGLAALLSALFDAISVHLVVPSSVVTVLGLLGAVLVLYRLVNPPGTGEVSLGVGIFLALFASSAIVYGGWVGMREEGRGFANDPDLAPDPEPEERPGERLERNRVV